MMLWYDFFCSFFSLSNFIWVLSSNDNFHFFLCVHNSHKLNNLAGQRFMELYNSGIYSMMLFAFFS